MTGTAAADPDARSEQNNPWLGIWLMVAATFVFAVNDALSRHLADQYNVLMIVMIRYWFFAVFAAALAARQPGGIRRAAQTRQPLLHLLRAGLLAGEIFVMVASFVLLGLVASHAVFICYPLMIAALSGPLLGERVGRARWLAILAGFVGIIVILQPGSGVFQATALMPLLAASLFAVYSLLTRLAARRDRPETSFFWVAVVGAVVATLIGLWFWEPVAAGDWIWIIGVCITGGLGHWLVIRCYDVSEASTVQPFAYFHLVFGAAAGVLVFHEAITLPLAIGAAIVVAAGLFTLARERRAIRRRGAARGAGS